MILDLDLIFASKIIAKMEPKKPQSLLKKYFQMWCKITKLIVRIFLKERYLSKYPDLNKFKRKDQLLFRNEIKYERIKLNELKRELKELV